MDDLEAEKGEELKDLEVSLKYGTRRNIFWGLPITIHDKIELREKTKERVDKIEKLRRKKETELENFSNIDNDAIHLLVEIYIDKKDRKEELILIIEIKLKKINISEKTIKAIRSQIIGHSSLSIYDF